MQSSKVLDQVLALARGALRDSTGRPLATPDSRAMLVMSHAGGDADAARAALRDGHRVVIPVGNAGAGVGRVLGSLTMRLRLWRARRWLTAAGAGRVRSLAAVPSNDALYVLYEVGNPAQRYVEGRIVLDSGSSNVRDAVKAVISLVGGVAAAAELVVVVGERG